MVKARTWLTLFILSLGTVTATASCGGSDEGTGGNTGGVSGGGLVGGGSGGRAGAVGRAGAGGAPAGAGLLAATCAADADCGAGFTCLTPTSTTLPGGGPANGMCTKACADSTDCAAIQPGAECFEFGTQAAPASFCLAGCEQGTPDEAAQDTKCQGRGDLSCIDFSDRSVTDTPEPFCYPLCRADVECGTGLYCNKGSGLCSKTKLTGDPVGTRCTPGAATDNCEGFCIRTSATGVTPVVGVCAEFCAGLLPCGYVGEQPGGLCIGQLSENFGLLDLGYCLPNCSCTGECPFPGDVCRAWAPSEATFAQELGAPGLCYPSAVDSTALAACAEGGAGGVGNSAGAGGTPGDATNPPGDGLAGDSGLGAGGTSGAGG